LWVYTEDIGNFKQPPLDVIRSINAQNMYGRDNWRIPTPDELAVLENNADKVGLGDDIYLATDHANGILRLVSTNETKKDKAVRLGEGVLINGVTWAKQNVGANNSNPKGREFTFSQALNACPDGWRLPKPKEFNNLINSGKADFGKNGNNELFFPYTRVSEGNYGNNYYCEYWILRQDDLNYAYVFSFRYFASFGGYGNPHSSGTDEPTFDTRRVNAEGVCVRCVLDE
jgi:uncharacterized protein (TIGR02145 family)